MVLFEITKVNKQSDITEYILNILFNMYVHVVVPKTNAP